MSTAPAAGDLRERRKMVRVRLRSDLEIAPQKYEGRTYYVVKDPVSLRYYRFKEQEHFLLQYMDGKRTLDQAQKEFEKRFRPDRLTLEDLEGFAQQLLTAGLAQNETPQAGKLLFDRRKKRRRSEWMQLLTNILYIKIPIFDPDKLLTRMLPYLRFIFTTWFFLLSIGVMLGAILLVATHFQVFRDKLPSYQWFFSFNNVAYMWIALGAVKIIHEFGHGLSCKAFGGEVHEMGALFLVFSPCLYCNVSDAWRLPSKWKRIIISAAGIYVELIIAAIATFVWWNTPAHPWLNNLSLSLMIVCSVSTVVFNANPLMRYDGYYILADWLEIPNLRDRSNRFLKNLVLEHCLGVEVQPEPYMALWRKVLFVVYAVVSYVYRWVITYAILIFMANFLGDKLKIISQMLAIGAVASMVGWPLYRLGKNLHKRGRLPDMKSGRVTVCVLVLVAVVVAFFFLPLPVSRIRQTGLVELPDEAVETVAVPSLAAEQTAPVLQQLHVRDGQHVQKGDELAQFTSLDLETKLFAAEAEYKNRLEQLAFHQQLTTLTSISEQDRRYLQDRIVVLTGERDDFAGKKYLYEQMKKKLKLLAPRSGVVISPPRMDEVGRVWEGEQREFCKIGDIGAKRRLRVRLPITPAERELLLQDSKNNGLASLEVVLRVRGRDSSTWRGTLAYLQESSVDNVPEQLTSKRGGPIATKPSQNPSENKAQSQQFFAHIDIEDPDDAICPGTLAQVKVHCKWKSSAWWVWRKLNDTFDLGLL